MYRFSLIVCIPFLKLNAKILSGFVFMHPIILAGMLFTYSHKRNEGCQIFTMSRILTLSVKNKRFYYEADIL